MSPSSTSSSEPEVAATDGGGDDARQPLLSPAGKRGLLVCLAILLLIEVAVARPDWAWRLDPRRPVGILLEVEEKLLAPVETPRVVVLGSSVMRDGLLPRAFETSAGLPSGAIVNASLPNATPFDFCLLYERNREKIAQSRLLVAGIEDWYFYEEPGVSERYHRWASLSQRWRDYAGMERAPLIVSWLWKTYAARQALAFDAIVASVRGERADVIGDDGRVRWRPEEVDMGPESFDLAGYEARLREREWRDRQARYLRELGELAAEDHVPLVVVRMPMRARAFELRKRVSPDAEPRLQDVLATLRAGADAPTVLDIPTGEPAGLEERHFLDERHLATEGARRFTRYLAAWVAGEYALQ